MSRKVSLWFYVIAVDVAAIAAIVLMPVDLALQRWATLLLLVVLGGLIGGQPVRIESLRIQMLASHPLVVCALAALGPQAMAWTALATVVGAWIMKERKPTTIRLVFNLGAQVVAAAAAGLTFALLSGDPGAPLMQVLGPLAFATAAFFVTNTFMVSVAVGIESGQSILRTWRDSFLWAIASYLTGFTLAVGLLFILDRLGPWGLALALPPCWLLLSFYKTHREKIQEHQLRIQEIETLNADLETKVRERTREVREALARIEQTNRQLRDANEQLVAANRAKSEFLANVSHELRTPLNSVIGFSELIADESMGSLNERQRELLEDIRGSGEHLLNLITDILDLSKVEAGKMELHRSAVAVHELVEKSADMVRPLAAKKNLELVVECEPSIGIGDLDAGMFRGVLVNLLSNAVKFTPEGGNVRVQARKSKESDLVLSVRDSGIGICEADQRRIFQEFYQADGSYTREYQGTGLGLALVKRMVEMHDGTVSVESAPGEGACFTCVYPGCLEAPDRWTDAPGPAPAMSPESLPEPPLTTILLVEAHGLSRKLARNVLRSRGYHVTEVTRGEQVGAALRRRRPQLILIDVDLPDRDGLDVVEELKQEPATSGIPVVALSAHPERDRARAEQAGCAGLIGTPIRLATFPGQIESVVSPKESVA